MRSTELLCNEAKIWNIIRVINIQQEKQCISGVTQSGYAYAREMFCVYTDDGLFQKLYRYDETERILPDLLKSGYISFEYYYGAESVITPNGTKVIEGQKILRKELKKQLSSKKSR